MHWIGLLNSTLAEDLSLSSSERLPIYILIKVFAATRIARWVLQLPHNKWLQLQAKQQNWMKHSPVLLSLAMRTGHAHSLIAREFSFLSRNFPYTSLHGIPESAKSWQPKRSFPRLGAANHHRTQLASSFIGKRAPRVSPESHSSLLFFHIHFPDIFAAQKRTRTSENIFTSEENGKFLLI